MATPIIKDAGTVGEIPQDDETTKEKPYYGDLVCAVAFTAVTPVDGTKAFATCQEEGPDICTIAVLSVTFCAIYGGLSWVAYLKHSNAFSFAAFLAGLWLCAFNNINGWPYPNECVIVPQFQGVLVGTLSNGALSFQNKMIRFALMFGVASYVSITSPHSVYKKDVLPLLGGPIALSILVLSWNRFNFVTIQHEINWNAITVRGSRYLLTAIFMHHTANELLSMTKNEQIAELVSDNSGNKAMDTLWTIVKASFVACVGVLATGTFQKEIDLNEKLEVLVQERTKEIQQKNDKLHMVELALRASETAIAITDSDGTIIWLNAACETITSLSKTPKETNLLGKPLVEVLHLETMRDEKKLRNAFSNNRREDEICIREMIYHLEVSPYEYSSAGSKSGRFMVVLKNITSERAREVAEKVAQEEAMMAKAMGDSMVTLTHELRTPMQGIMGVTGMLLQQNRHLEQQSDTSLIGSLKLIMASSGLLLNLINNLLDVKKFDSEMMDDFPLSPVVARSAIRDTIDFCQPLASISGVAVVTNSGEEVNYQVISNALRLQQVLINLVSNAIKYTSEDSEIRINIQPTIKADVESRISKALASSSDSSNVTTTENKKSVDPTSPDTPILCFSISDQGPGIAPHQADRLFQRFARLDNKPTRALGGSNKVGQPSGTGLGLNLCQAFVQQMNGEIWATNNSDGKGSTFSFYLPLAAESISISPLVSSVPSNIKRRGSFQDLEILTSQMRVLLVDDVLINRKVIGRMVKLVGVADIDTVDSGPSAIREINENGPYDLVITDLQMPGMSGSELSTAIMKDKSCSDIRKPVVVGLTADTSVKVAEQCKDSGMSTVLYKPISVIEMREFFETTVMRLEPGVWYAGRENGAILSAQ